MPAAVVPAWGYALLSGRAGRNSQQCADNEQSDNYLSHLGSSHFLNEDETQSEYRYGRRHASPLRTRFYGFLRVTAVRSTISALPPPRMREVPTTTVSPSDMVNDVSIRVAVPDA